MPDVDFIHTGPETLAGRYMRMFWQRHLPRAGSLRNGRGLRIWWLPLA